MSDLKGMRVNAAVEAELDDGAYRVAAQDASCQPSALPPPWALLVDEVLASEDDGRCSRQYRDGTSWPYAPYEVIL